MNDYQTMKRLGLWLEQISLHPEWSVFENYIKEVIEQKTNEVINSSDDEHKITFKRGIVAGMLRYLNTPRDIISQFGSQGTVKEPDEDLTKAEGEV